MLCALTVRSLEPGTFDALRASVVERIDVFDITGALEAIWEVVRTLNKYVTDEKPWELAKDDANAARLDDVLYTLVDGLRAVGLGRRHGGGGVGHGPGGVVVGRPRRVRGGRLVGLAAPREQSGDLVALEEDAGGDDRGSEEQQLA